MLLSTNIEFRYLGFKTRILTKSNTSKFNIEKQMFGFSPDTSITYSPKKLSTQEQKISDLTLEANSLAEKSNTTGENIMEAFRMLVAMGVAPEMVESMRVQMIELLEIERQKGVNSEQLIKPPPAKAGGFCFALKDAEADLHPSD